MTTADPHSNQPVESAGVDPDTASVGIVLAHGRGARAASMLQFARSLGVAEVAYLAPQAAQNTWYPNRFLAPVESNEPWLSSALTLLGDTVDRLRGAGLADERIVIGGFSQGACLASEFVARNPRQYGGLLAFSGGLIGPEGTDFAYEGDLRATPVFLGCDEADPHIPIERVRETADAFEGLGGDVTERTYTGIGHTINSDEQAFAAALLAGLAEA